jgi:hypothetical protein
MRVYFYIIVVFVFASGCGPDNFRPVVQTLIVNNVNTDMLPSDTIFNVTFPIESEFELTDNEGVEKYRFEFNRTNDSIPDFHSIDLGNVGGLKEFTGFTTVDFDQSILDTLPENPGYYFISVDCFDLTGNEAIQKKVIIEIVIN